MQTSDQRLINLTARVDQLEAAAKTNSKVTGVLWLCLACLAIIVLARVAHGSSV